jgi:hypothetical protein
MRRTLYGASKDQRIAARYIPKNASRVALKDGSATVYLYTARDKLFAVGYRGTAGRSEFHYSFRTDVQRRQYVEGWFAGVRQSQGMKATRRAKQAAWTNPLKPDQILYTSWGYDQTNVEFYVVTRVSGRKTWIREIAQAIENTGFMSGTCRPQMPIHMVGEEMSRIAQPLDGDKGVYLRITGSAHAWPDDGGKHGWSSYA